MKLKTNFFKIFIAFSAIFSCSVYAEDDYGCTVLLCLANPNGPKAVAECVPSINRLYNDLAHGRAFPTCVMSGDQNKNKATNQFVNANYCHPSLLSRRSTEDTSPWFCEATGAITVIVDGQIQSRIWWGNKEIVESTESGFVDPNLSLKKAIDKYNKENNSY